MDAGGHVRFAKRFLSKPEVRYVLALVEATGGWEPSPSGGPHYEVPSRRGGRFEAALRRDPVVARIEARIAAATGIAPHPHEDLLSLARLTSRGAAPRGGNFAPFGLHHETDTRPHRARTVLVYMAAPSGGGGHTIFPCLEPRKAVARLQRRGQAQGKGQPQQQQQQQQEEPGAETADARALRKVRKGMFVEALGAQFGGRDNGWSRHVSFDIHLEHPFNDLLADVCAGREGVSVAPRAGAALLWDSLVLPADLGSEAAPLRRLASCNMTWHAGCNVLHGSSPKIMMQKFKELPAALRPRNEGPRGNPLDFPYNPWVV